MVAIRFCGVSKEIYAVCLHVLEVTLCETVNVLPLPELHVDGCNSITCCNYSNCADNKSFAGQREALQVLSFDMSLSFVLENVNCFVLIRKKILGNSPSH